MKNFKVLYFLPVLLLISIFVFQCTRYSDFEGLVNPIFWFNTIYMTTIGIIMCKGKKVGAYLGIIYGISWIIYDIVYHKISGFY